MDSRWITIPGGVALILGGIIVAVLGLPHVVSTALLLIGLLGLHHRQGSQAGYLSRLSLAFVILGFVLLADRDLVEVLFPQLAATAVANLAAVLIPGLIVTLGILFMGLSLLRSGVFPRRTAFFMILTVGLVLVTGPIGAVLFGTSLAWLGYQLLTGRDINGADLPR